MYLQQQSARLQHFEFTCKNSNVSIFNCMIVAIYFSKGRPLILSVGLMMVYMNMIEYHMLQYVATFDITIFAKNIRRLSKFSTQKSIE